MAKPAPIKEHLKAALGHGVAAVLPQCRFERSLFILAHMRCGSTALSNILCSRPDVSGYGEAHIGYTGRDALGRLVVNQARRGGWTPGARSLFDKILHSRHDRNVPADFFSARAIFIARRPGPSVRSIRKLYQSLGRAEYATDTDAAIYYLDRVTDLIGMWHRFPADRRVGLTHADLLADPDAALTRISNRLQIAPPLENRYRSPRASRRGGGGDPTASGKHTRIETRPDDPTGDMAVALDIPPDLRAAIEQVYARFIDTISE